MKKYNIPDCPVFVCIRQTIVNLEKKKILILLENETLSISNLSDHMKVHIAINNVHIEPSSKYFCITGKYLKFC